MNKNTQNKNKKREYIKRGEKQFSSKRGLSMQKT